MTLKKKRLITNIVFYVFIVIMYAFAATMLVIKFAGGNTVYLFNTRYDVVLSGSMSEKNENHLDFLEGTEQIQKFDVVRSKKVNDETELKTKDIVLFVNHDLNDVTDMHRIVNVIEKYDSLTVYNCSKQLVNGLEAMKLVDYSSTIKLSSKALSKIELYVISKEQYDDDYSFGIGGDYYPSTSSVEQSGDYYKGIVTCNNPSSAPKPISIVKNNIKDSYIEKVVFTTTGGESFEFSATEYENTEALNIFEKHLNIYELYEIRGDKAKDSDGVFERKDIISKVTNVIPKGGYVVRYLTSIPGVLMFVGLGIIITIGSYFYNKNSVKKEETSINNDEKN